MVDVLKLFSLRWRGLKNVNWRSEKMTELQREFLFYVFIYFIIKFGLY